MGDPPEAYMWVVLIVFSMLSGIFSGLNLGLMSLTVEDLNIIIKSSDDPGQVRNASLILPVRKRGNLLLCTLLIGNTVVNVMLSVLTDPIWTFLFGSGIAGTVLSLAVPSVIIVVFGEIVPQSVCSRYALSIGARTLPLTYFFLAITVPFALPIASLLDRILGAEIGSVYTRQGLFELIKLNTHSAAHAKESGLTKEDAKLLGGALTFKDRSVASVMTPIERVYSLPIEAVLDQPTFLAILERGHTRVPVYEGTPTNIVGLLLVKNLLGIGYEKNMKLSTIIETFAKAGGQTPVQYISQATKLDVALDVCKKKRLHMLMVCEGSDPERSSWSKSDLGGVVVGVVTIEDFIEEILQDEIVDETDVYINNSALDLVADVSSTSETSMKKPVGRINSKHFDTTAVLRHL